MLKYATISAISQNKKLTNKHHSLFFIATNNIMYFVNNNPNQLHTKVKTKKQLHIKTYNNYIYIIQNAKNKNKK
jgi:hypothetical protein